MEKNENISRRDALKRMSKTAIAVAVVSMFPSVKALANDSVLYDKYINYDNYKNYADYTNYKNYDDYTNYDNYINYRDYANCQ